MLSEVYRESVIDAQSDYEFSSLSLCRGGIRILNNVPRQLHFLSRLYLDDNHLQSLNGIQQFHNLQCLHFNFNHVSLPTEFMRITNPFFMLDISFVGNPVEYQHQVDVHWLRSCGFTRLCVMNGKRRPRNCQQCGWVQSLELSNNRSSYPLEKTNQHKSHWANPLKERQSIGQVQTSKYTRHTRKGSLVGKLYWNNTSKQKTGIQLSKNDKLATNATYKRYNRTGRTKLTQTKDLSSQSPSTNQLSMIEHHQIRPFREIDELDDEEDNEVGTSLDHTAKFDLAVPRASLAKQVIEEQKIYYASLFYRRGLIETLFSRWKTAVGMQLKQHPTSQVSDTDLTERAECLRNAWHLLAENDQGVTKRIAED